MHHHCPASVCFSICFYSGLFVLHWPVCFLKKESKEAWSQMGGETENLRGDEGDETMNGIC